MQSLKEQFRHNRWANARVFKVSLAADPSLLRESADGTVGSIDESLRHMVTVEEGFAAVVATAGGPKVAAGVELLVTPTGLSDGYTNKDLPWYAERIAYLDDFLSQVAAEADDGLLERPATVPWLPFPMHLGECLFQVLVHNSHHRSQVFSALGDRGVKVPDLDYVIMLAKERTTG